MTGIEAIGWPTAPRAVTRATTAKSRFFVPSEPAETGQAAAASPTTAPASMLALQEFGSESVTDREARRHGKDMLAALAALQRALLGGGDDTVALQRLTQLTAAVACADDPRLAALVAAIVVRARVELARRQNSCMSTG